MASAICPNCKILLVEASTRVVRESRRGGEQSSGRWARRSSRTATAAANTPASSATEAHFNHPGIAITVSSGDSGYGVEFPASSQYVTAVGGTTLTTRRKRARLQRDGVERRRQRLQRYIAKPSWQTDAGCARRTVGGRRRGRRSEHRRRRLRHLRPHPGGWLVFGGTSVAAPIIAGVYALSGNASSITYGSYSYSHLASIFDVLSGSNGSCGGSYLCTGKAGYDGPTGNGTPNGTGGF